MSSDNDRIPADDQDRFWIDDFQSDHRAVIRPYVRTGGRSRPSHDLRLETLVSGLWPEQAPLIPNARRTPDLEVIRELCRGAPLSIAEISAHLSIALGVARILVSDAINAGMCVRHETADTAGSQPSMDLLARVHKGLRRLV
ncbi:DUF742 domain-containing protein [Labedaea rhizosphaerae]|uniref:Uncharacterized protein DUF742 n=1 Tax=Labedaea rhizosphaerae TaxID=598644 RepID=A0A4R6S5J8_LABRH|nr:DUF742 domain-containing protein [Labedaea rhizosphaerae]TDP94005.1 uncharacterized protein DUF742 [Labedaea rhizosphaerae]